jgi:hypothetical protein
VEYTNILDGNMITDKVKINLNMLDALVLNVFGGEVYGVDVVAQAAGEVSTPLPHRWP